MRMMRHIAALLLTIATVTAASATPAHAIASTKVEILFQLGRHATSLRQLQQQVDLQLKYAPGGTQTSANEVSYSGGTFVVTFAMPGIDDLGWPDCPQDWFCFYDNVKWGYPRGKLSGCGWQDLATWRWNDRTESVDNRTPSAVGYIQHWDGGNPGNGHNLDYELFRNGAYVGYSPVESRNTADHVYRWC